MLESHHSAAGSRSGPPILRRPARSLRRPRPWRATTKIAEMSGDARRSGVRTPKPGDEPDGLANYPFTHAPAAFPGDLARYLKLKSM